MFEPEYPLGNLFPGQTPDPDEERRRQLEAMQAARRQRLMAQGDTTADVGAIPGPPQPDSIGPAAEPLGEPDERGFIRKTFASMTRGGLEAVDETVDFLTPGLDVNLFADDGEDGLLFNLPKAPEGVGYDLVEGFTQFGVGMLGAGKILKATGLGSKAALGASRILRGTRGGRAAVAGLSRVPGVRHIASSRTIARMVPIEMASAITDAVAFDPYDDRLTDLISGLTGGRSDAILGWLDADEDTPELQARALAALEGGLIGVGLGVTIEGIWRGLRIKKIRQQMQTGRMTPEEARVAAHEVSAAPLPNDDAIAVFHNANGTLTGRVKQAGNFVADPREFVVMAQRRMQMAWGRPELPTDEDYLPLNFDPDEDVFMFHATAAKGKIIDNGLMSASEANVEQNLGGGGQGISVTWSEQKAESIAHFTRGAAMVARGDMTRPSEIIDHFSDTFIYDNPFTEVFDDTAHTFLRNSLGMREADEIMGGQSWEDWLHAEGLGSTTKYDDAPDWMIEEFEEAVGTDPDAILERFDRVLEAHADRAQWDEDDMKIYLGRLYRWFDSIQSDNLARSITDAATDDEFLRRYGQMDPDQIGVVQVAVRRDVPWRTGDVATDQNPYTVTPIEEEYELQFRSVKGKPSELVEVVERIDLANEAQASALNTMMKQRLSGLHDIPQKKLNDTVRFVAEMMRGGVDPFGPEIQQTLGLNLGLFIKTYEDFVTVSKAITDSFPEEMRAARARAGDGFESSTWEATYQRAAQRLADAMGEGTQLEQVEAWARSTLTPDAPHDEVADRVLSASMLMNFLGQDIKTLADATYFAADASPERAMLGTTLTRVVRTFADIQVRVAGLQSETGRILNSFKLRGMSPDEYAEAIGKASRRGEQPLNQFEHLGKTFTPEEIEALTKSLMLANGDPQLIRDTIIHMAKLMKEQDAVFTSKGVFEKVNRYRTAMMLYGPKTHAINILNNAMVAAYLPFENIVAGAMKLDPTLMRFGVDQYVGMMSHLAHSFNAAITAFRTGKNILAPGARVDEGILAVPKAISNLGQLFNGFVDLPGRSLMSADEFFKNVNYFGYAHAQAMERVRKEAIEAGLEGQALRDFVTNKTADIMRHSVVNDTMAGMTGLPKGAALNLKAMDYAAYGTFTNDLKGWAKGLQNFANEHPSARFIMPFIRTPINLVRFSMERTPGLALFMDSHREMLAQGGRQRAIALSRQAIGTAIWGTGAMLFMGGRITGRGPTDYEMRKQWMDAGNQPYSFKVGNRWISYARVEPLATAFGVLADGWEIVNEHDEGEFTDEFSQVATAAIAGIMANASQKTFILGLTDVLNAVSGDDPRKVERLIGNVATSFSPNFLSQFNQDPHYREARSIFEAMKRRQFYGTDSESLEPRRNILGEKVLKPIGFPGRGFLNAANTSLNPFTVSYVAPEKKEIQMELLELGRRMPFPQPTRGEGKIDLRDRDRWDETGDRQSPYDRILEIVNEGPGDRPPLRQALEELLASKKWEEASAGTSEFPGGKRYELASGLIQGYYQMAEGQVYDEYPRLLEEIKAVSQAEADAIRGRESDQETLDILRR